MLGRNHTGGADQNAGMEQWAIKAVAVTREEGCCCRRAGLFGGSGRLPALSWEISASEQGRSPQTAGC